MIIIKTEKEIALMAEAGIRLAKVMNNLKKQVRPGISTEELDRVAETLILNAKARCSFKDFQGYPRCSCISLNNEIVHAVPSARIIKENDIVSLDLGLCYQGFHADMAVTLPVGKIDKKTRELVEVTKKALATGIKEIKPGRFFGDISCKIQQYVESQGFSVVRELCGHGIGRDLHEDPEILNYGEKGTGPEIKEGMVFCLEPMVTSGSWQIKKSRDGQGFLTKDGSLSAHFEHTIAVTKKGVKILTDL